MKKSNPSLTPLIKWSGGKRSEIPLLRPAYPKNIRRVIEPFAGGAAVSLDLNPGQAVLGDVSGDLIDFYLTLSREDMREAFVERVEDIHKIRLAIQAWVDSLSDTQIKYLSDRAVAIKQARVEARKASSRKLQAQLGTEDGQGVHPVSGIDEVLDPVLIRSWVAHIRCGTSEQNEVMVSWMVHDIEASLLDKMSRVEKLGQGRDQGGFDGEELRPHLLTALHAGVYTSLRRTYNGQALRPGALETGRKRKTKASRTEESGHIATVENSTEDNSKELKDACGDGPWRVAAWYVVRNLCYAGMFRFGPNGQFNVPYGGISYNSRDFSKTRAALLDKDVRKFFDNAKIYQIDFDGLFNMYGNFNGPESGDFIFLDPPYDSAFSQYNSEGDFTQEDQKRLANRLRKVSTPWMLVIKYTDFIASLYQDNGGVKLYRYVFGKSYQVNIRNRNEADVQHLVVTNYPIDVAATVEGGGSLSLLP